MALAGERQPPMPRLIIPLLAAALAVAAIVAGIYFAQPNPLARRVHELERELTAARAENARLQAALEKRTPVKPTARPTPPVASTPAAPSEAIPTTSNAVPKMAELAAQREQGFKYYARGIERDYGRLFKSWGLTKEEADHITRILVDRQTKMLEITTKRGQMGLTEAQKRALAEESAAVKQETDTAIAQFLNDDADYQAYLEWEDTVVERIQMQFAVTSFDSVGETLSGEQRDQLQALIIAHRITPAQRSSFAVPGATSESMRDQMLKQRAANEAAILKEAASFLSAGQLAHLQKIQDERMTSMRVRPK